MATRNLMPFEFVQAPTPDSSLALGMTPRGSSAAQRGAALMVALMFLLVLTMLGLAAVRATTQQTRMATAMQFQSSAFQAGEAAIRLIMSEINAVGVNTLAPILNSAAACPSTLISRTPYADTSVVSSSATIVFRGACTTMGACGTAVSAGTDPGVIVIGDSLDSSFASCCFDIDASSQYGSSSAGSVQQQRVAIRCPNQT